MRAPQHTCDRAFAQQELSAAGHNKHKGQAHPDCLPEALSSFQPLLRRGGGGGSVGMNSPSCDSPLLAAGQKSATQGKQACHP